MKKEELFNDDFLKQIKTGDELNGFLKELQKRGIENLPAGRQECLKVNLTGIWITIRTKNPRLGTPAMSILQKQCVLPSGNRRLLSPETGMPVLTL